MTIVTHTTDRKALAQAMAKELGVACTYMGIPSYGYRVGDFTIDREGNIIGEDFRALRGFLQRKGIAVNEAIFLDSGAVDTMEISTPVPDITPVQLKNLIYLLYNKQILINRMTQSECLSIPDRLIESLEEHLPITIDDFSLLLSDFEVKGLSFENRQIRITFPFDESEPQKWTAYANLLTRLIEAARKATRFQPRKATPNDENEKYLAHILLHRLGYSGSDLKAERKILLGHLHGCCAFSTREKSRAHQERYAKRRRENEAQTQDDSANGKEASENNE